MTDIKNLNQLTFPFLNEQPPETDVLAEKPGGSFVEAEQFVFPLFPNEMEYPTVEFFEKFPYIKE